MTGRIIFGAVAFIFAIGYAWAAFTPEAPGPIYAQADSIFTAKGLSELTCSGGLIVMISILLLRVVPSMIKEQAKSNEAHAKAMQSVVTDFTTTLDTVCERTDQTIKETSKETREVYKAAATAMTELRVHCQSHSQE